MNDKEFVDQAKERLEELEAAVKACYAMGLDITVIVKRGEFLATSFAVGPETNFELRATRTTDFP